MTLADDGFSELPGVGEVETPLADVIFRRMPGL